MDDHPLFVICSQMMADFCALVDRAAFLVDPGTAGRTAITVETDPPPLGVEATTPASGSGSGPGPAYGDIGDHLTDAQLESLIRPFSHSLARVYGESDQDPPFPPPLGPPHRTRNNESQTHPTTTAPDADADADATMSYSPPTLPPTEPEPEPEPETDPPTTFPPFPLLPQELQDRVIAHALSAATPRVHALDVVPRRGTVTLAPTPALAASTRAARALGAVSRSVRGAVERELPHAITLLCRPGTGTAGRVRLDARAGGDVVLLNGLDARVMDLFNAAVAGGGKGHHRARTHTPGLRGEGDGEAGSSSPTGEEEQQQQEEEEEEPPSGAGIARLGLPTGMARLAIAVPDDFYYRAFNVWPLGWSDGATNVLRRFVLAFPALESLFLEAAFPILCSGVAQARALIRDLSDPEWAVGGWEGGFGGKRRVLGHVWIRGTADRAVPPWFEDWGSARGGGDRGRVLALPAPPDGSYYVEDGGLGGSGSVREGRDGESGSGSGMDTSRMRPDDQDTADEGKVWYLAAKPYHNWGAGIPALSKVMDANLWRQARLKKVMGGNDDDVGLLPEEVKRLEAVDVSMLLGVEW